MDVYTVKENLKSWKDAEPIETADRIHKATIVGMLEANITESFGES